jgi:hypothetical protein
MMGSLFEFCPTRSAAGGFLLAFAACTAFPAVAGPSALDLTCSGNSYGKEGNPFPATETVSFSTDGKGLVMLGLPWLDKPTKARVVSANPIQLRFAAGGVIGEYFNFTGDLFLIHKDGRFTRLVCKPKA